MFSFFLLYRYIVTDCDSLDVMFKDQKFLDDMPEDAVAQALRAGRSFTGRTDFSYSCGNQDTIVK